MIEYEELRADIDRYLMERFKYRKSLVCLCLLYTSDAADE